MAEIAGLKLIVPSSVVGSGVSVSASGKVTFTAATSISINGVFDSTYDNYLIVARHIHSATTNIDIDGRLRASGTDASGTDYTEQYITVSASTIAALRETSQTSYRFAITSSSDVNGSHSYLYGPALAQPTTMHLIGSQATSGARLVDNVATHTLSTAYDGITIFPTPSGTITGVLCVYGLAQ